MARITVAAAMFTDALDQDDPMSLDEQYPDGGYVNEDVLADETADPLYKLMAKEASNYEHTY